MSYETYLQADQNVGPAPVPVAAPRPLHPRFNGYTPEELYQAAVRDSLIRTGDLPYEPAVAQHQQTAVVQHFHTAPPPQYPYPAQLFAPQPEPAVPAWVKRYAAITLSTGGTCALIGLGLNLAAPALPYVSTILYSAAAIGATVMVAVAALRNALRTRMGGGSAPGARGVQRVGDTHIHQSVVNRGVFSRGSINNTFNS
ncbi:hypothetical protein ACGFYY_32665 [Streptomyces sp. NPDC048331]|uniref:hypothetical protein n=1 Tax=Streptomyces sp. NPDC048331 TaxID=3365534 RepID=UPI00371A9A43